MERQTQLRQLEALLADAMQGRGHVAALSGEAGAGKTALVEAFVDCAGQGVTLLRSVINTPSDHRATVRGLGLRRLNHTVELEDTPAVRGMINKVIYLLSFEG